MLGFLHQSATLALLFRTPSTSAHCQPSSKKEEISIAARTQKEIPGTHLPFLLEVPVFTLLLDRFTNPKVRVFVLCPPVNDRLKKVETFTTLVSLPPPLLRSSALSPFPSLYSMSGS